MQQFRSLVDTHVNYAKKFIRYNGARPVKLIDNASGQEFMLHPGATGICHTVRGAVMYVSFENNKPGPLPRKSPPMWPYQTGIYPHQQSVWQVEA